MLGVIGDLLGLNKGKATEAAAKKNAALINSYNTDATGIIDAGFEGSKGYLDQSNALASMGANGAGMFANAMGLNGADGTAAAQGAFQQGPGYQFQMDQGLQALERRASAQGRLGSGQTGLDTMTYAQGLANQGWNDWLGNLNSGIDRNIGTLGDLASLYGNDANQRLGLAGNVSSGLMAANNQTASGKEAGQGAIWEPLQNIAGIAGSFMGMGGMGGGAAAGAGAGVGQGLTGASTYNTPGQGSYGMFGYGR